MAKPFVYVITDFTPAIIDSLKENPLFSKFVDDGILDFGLYGIFLCRVLSIKF